MLIGIKYANAIIGLITQVKHIFCRVENTQLLAIHIVSNDSTVTAILTTIIKVNIIKFIIFVLPNESKSPRIRPSKWI